MTDHDQGDHVYLSTAVAAEIFRVNPRTIRKRITAGTLQADKVGSVLMVRVPRQELIDAGVDPEQWATADPAAIESGEVITMPVPRQSMAPATIDIEPLTQTIRDLTTRNEQLAAEAAAAATRAEIAERTAQERADQLTAAETTIREVTDRATSAEQSAQVAASEAASAAQELERMRLELERASRPWWKKLLAIE